MATITHPSMRRVKDTSIQQPESYIVEDAGLDENDYDTDFGEINDDLAEPTKPQLNHNKKMLEDLLFLGKATKDVNIAEHVFKLSTLTHREHNSLMKELYKFGTGADLFTLRTITLAFALKSVDGVNLEDVSESDENLSIFEKKMLIIDSMQMNIVTKLYEHYDKLSTSTDKNLDGQEIKK